MLQRLNEGFGHVGPGDSVPRGEGVAFLTDFDCSSAAWAVEEEARSNDRVVDTARANLVFRAPPPAQRVSLDEV